MVREAWRMEQFSATLSSLKNLVEAWTGAIE